MLVAEQRRGQPESIGGDLVLSVPDRRCPNSAFSTGFDEHLPSL